MASEYVELFNNFGKTIAEELDIDPKRLLFDDRPFISDDRDTIMKSFVLDGKHRFFFNAELSWEEDRLALKNGTISYATAEKIFLKDVHDTVVNAIRRFFDSI